MTIPRFKSKDTTNKLWWLHDSFWHAEAFKELIDDASDGRIRVFYSTEERAAGGILYGEEWHSRIMGELREAAAVVSLITPRSLKRPWIVYEAGVALGRNVPVQSLAIGVSTEEAATGPFQFYQLTRFIFFKRK